MKYRDEIVGVKSVTGEAIKEFLVGYHNVAFAQRSKFWESYFSFFLIL